METTINVGIIGIGGMGRTHFSCYRNNPAAKIVALCDLDEGKRTGQWGTMEINIGSEEADTGDMSGIASYEQYSDLLADPEVRLVDICLPTRLHAEVSIAALMAGKDVFCEKPMAWTVDECREIQKAIAESGRQFFVGHCLRYWSHYLKINDYLQSGEYGAWRYARLARSGGAPTWSWNNWLMTGSQSGGAVFDMHIHDADAALWWFGKPEGVHAAGVVVDGLPLTVDANWSYPGGRVVNLHGSWDLNSGPFRYAFDVVFEKATVSFDSAVDDSVFRISTTAGAETVNIDAPNAYQYEIDDILDCLKSGRKMERVTPAGSEIAVQVVREELRQIESSTR